MTLFLLASILVMQSDTTGRFIAGEYDGDGGARTYRLYVPSSYDGGKAVPLVVALHGCTQDGADLAAGTRLNETAERDGFLVVYPEQSAAANPLKCWNWYLPANQGAGGEVSIVTGITKLIQREYEVDAERTFIAGISAGAALAVHAVVAHPDLYHGVALHSGVPFRAAASVAEAMQVMQTGAADPAAAIAGVAGTPVPPAIIFHGVADAVVSVRNAEQLASQWTLASGAPGDGRKLKGEAGGRSYTRALHGADDRTVVELWLVEGLGHAWSGGSTAGTYADPAGPTATAEMIRFFLSL